MAWVDAACGFFDKERAGRLKPNDIYLFRVAQMLADYAVHGAVLRRYLPVGELLDGPGADAIVRFQAWLRSVGALPRPSRTYGTVAGEFVAFVGTRSGLPAATPARSRRSSPRWPVTGQDGRTETVCGTVVHQVRHRRRSARRPPCWMRCRQCRSSRQARVPSVWDPGDVARILEAIDRSNPCGKRDYAIILLVTRLGLRGVDVNGLEFADFDWPGNRLSWCRPRPGIGCSCRC
jgi:integrase